MASRPRATAAFEPRPAVFCTAYDAHALSAFDAQAINYPGSPVRPERLSAALARAAAAGRAQHVEHDDGQKRTHLCARSRGSLRPIPVEDIRYLQAEEKYVVVHHARGEDLIEESLKSLETGIRRSLRAHPPQLPGGAQRDRGAAPRRRWPHPGRAAAWCASAGSEPALRGAVAGDAAASVMLFLLPLAGKGAEGG